MPFSFAAAGTAAEAAAQLLAHSGNDSTEVAGPLRKILATALAMEEPSAQPGSEWRYAVQCSGHLGGAAPLTLTLTVTPHHVPVPGTPADAGEAS